MSESFRPWFREVRLADKCAIFCSRSALSEIFRDRDERVKDLKQASQILEEVRAEAVECIPHTIFAQWVHGWVFDLAEQMWQGDFMSGKSLSDSERRLWIFD